MNCAVGRQLCQTSVSTHFLTRKPSADQITTDCKVRSSTVNCLQCNSELSGHYTWNQENTETNYVLFILNQNTLLSKVILTYKIKAGNQKPKISFCAAPDSVGIESDFTGLECKEVSTEATGSEETQTLKMPFTNETSRIVMEVTTQGIKANFVATGVEFYGSNCTAVTGRVQKVK